MKKMIKNLLPIVLFISTGIYANNHSNDVRMAGYQKRSVDFAMQTVKNAKNSTSFIYGLNRFIAIVKDGYGFNEAIEAAQVGMLSKDPVVREVAMRLWSALFAQNQGVDAAIQVAERGMKSKNSSLKSNARQLMDLAMQQQAQRNPLYQGKK